MLSLPDPILVQACILQFSPTLAALFTTIVPLWAMHNPGPKNIYRDTEPEVDAYSVQPEK